MREKKANFETQEKLGGVTNFILPTIPAKKVNE